ncbi:MAG: putative metal-binding motif-containing protein [Alphaproteobacteria bacterium]|nr:putative metal-binding motif-containing protein [Alphaproteobacteria bacterium]
MFLNNGSLNGTTYGSAIRVESASTGLEVTVTNNTFTNNAAYDAHDGYLSLSGTASITWSLNQHLWAPDTGTGQVVVEGTALTSQVSGNNSYPDPFAAVGLSATASTTLDPGFAQPAVGACDYLDLAGGTGPGAFAPAGIQDADADGWIRPFDCDDGDPAVHPGAVDVCNGIDDDCDFEVDEDATTTDMFLDADEDGILDLPVVVVASCGPRRFLVEGCGGAPITSYTDADGDGFGNPGTASTVCPPPAGNVLDGTDCQDTGVGASLRFPGNPEVCDGIDNDCAGGADNGLTFVTWYQDQDGDGYGVTGSSVSTCDGAPLGYAAIGGDCDETGPDADLRFPGNPEVCDGVDNDCANGVDDGIAFAEYGLDLDGDGFGDPAMTQTTCSGAPAGYVGDLTDCDDTGPDAASRFPGNPEVCDGIDNDCLDGPDSGLTFLSYQQDLDGDGWGNENVVLSTCDGPPDGYVVTVGDCIDDPTLSPLAAFVYPGADEYCDGVDNDCDGLLDSDDPDSVAGLWYPDDDGDGFGDDGSIPDETCVPQTGWVSNGYDCDDGDPAVQPLAPDTLCNGVDDNCDGQVDEEAPFLDVFRDADMDGYGGTEPGDAMTVQCPGPGTSQVPGDCDDTDATVSPGQPDDDCDGVDEDCDGLADQDAPAVEVPQDLDRDGFAGDTTVLEQCPEVVPTVEDCDDGAADVHPGAQERCDAVDRDCDGTSGFEQLECGGPPAPTDGPLRLGLACSAGGTTLDLTSWLRRK